ncbi:MAG: dipicolinate synthase subunit B [Ruminococcus sp.]|nr:dipicolinate synthase subunit B [Ruminococcus sp.]
MSKTCIGYALCGSFCTFSKAIREMRNLRDMGYDVLPIMSKNASTIDTRFGKAKDFIEEIEGITEKKVINEITTAEPIGPKKMCDLILVSPCTGNTLGKVCLGITDTPVTMAVKSHLRVLRPVLLCVATNDALGASAQNIGRLLNTKNIFFVPFSQDDPENKPNSLVSHFELIPKCVEYALKKEQLQPVFR